MIGDGGPITDLAIRRVVLITMMANKTVATITNAFTLVMGALGAAGRGSFMPQELGGPWICLPPQDSAVADRQPRIRNRPESAPRQQCNPARPLFREQGLKPVIPPEGATATHPTGAFSEVRIRSPQR